jgi:hypothetical protein
MTPLEKGDLYDIRASRLPVKNLFLNVAPPNQPQLYDQLKL